MSYVLLFVSLFIREQMLNYQRLITIVKGKITLVTFMSITKKTKWSTVTKNSEKYAKANACMTENTKITGALKNNDKFL